MAQNSSNIDTLLGKCGYSFYYLDRLLT